MLRRAGFAAATAAAAAAAPAAVVNTSAGPVSGTGAAPGSCAAFYGVPYAAPPTGARRFRPPHPHPAWTAPRDATKVGRSCLQTFADGGVSLPLPVERALEELGNLTGSVPMEPMGEDCLFLNAFSPDLGASGLPVMVWFHGGSWLGGSGDLQSGIPFYDGRNLCEAGQVVVVTVNYRLGVFGFFASGELLAEGGTAGNMALQDQRAALAWVRDNARRFGGDPARVTIFGESAGGNSVAAHLLFRRSAPLFSAAVMQSGGLPDDVPLADAAAGYAGVAAAAGCPGAGLACLRQVGALDLLHAQMKAGGAGPRFVRDGYELPAGASGRELVLSGDFEAKPVMIGTNLNESALFECMGAPKDLNATAFRARVAGMFWRGAPTPAQLDELVALYDADARYGGSWRSALIDVNTDINFYCDSRALLDAMASKPDVPVYQYLLTHAPFPLSLDKCFGTPHMTDLFYLFLNFGELLTAEEKALSRRMAGYWTSFAKGHAPGAGWPQFGTAATRELLRLGVPGDAPSAQWKAAQCDVIEAVMGGAR